MASRVYLSHAGTKMNQNISVSSRTFLGHETAMEIHNK